MWVTLKFKNKKGEQFKSKEQLTVKKAIERFKQNLEKDDKIVKVWLVYFDGWHTRLYKTLKEANNET